MCSTLKTQVKRKVALTLFLAGNLYYTETFAWSFHSSFRTCILVSSLWLKMAKCNSLADHEHRSHHCSNFRPCFLFVWGRIYWVCSLFLLGSKGNLRKQCEPGQQHIRNGEQRSKKSHLAMQGAPEQPEIVIESRYEHQVTSLFVSGLSSSLIHHSS